MSIHCSDEGPRENLPIYRQSKVKAITNEQPHYKQAARKRKTENGSCTEAAGQENGADLVQFSGVQGPDVLDRLLLGPKLGVEVAKHPLIVIRNRVLSAKKLAVTKRPKPKSSSPGGLGCAPG